MRRDLDKAAGRDFASNEEGVAAIEFAALAFPFFLLIFAIVEVGLLFASELVLDNAVDRLGRELRTGQIQATNPTREKFAELVCERVSFMMDCSKLKIDLATFGQYADVGSRWTGQPRFDLGSGGTLMALTVEYDWPIYTHVLRAATTGKDGLHHMTGMAAFRTENF